MLYYNARYYDPAIGRFVSADSVVPGAGSLTVMPSDATAKAAWAKPSSGPGDAQALNRYSYVGNNPLRWTDPSGHVLVEAEGSEGRKYGYQEARQADGSVITDAADGKGNVLYQAHICNSGRSESVNRFV